MVPVKPPALKVYDAFFSRCKQSLSVLHWACQDFFKSEHVPDNSACTFRLYLLGRCIALNSQRLERNPAPEGLSSLLCGRDLGAASHLGVVDGRRGKKADSSTRPTVFDVVVDPVWSEALSSSLPLGLRSKQSEPWCL
jgi:hypothetical protein